MYHGSGSTARSAGERLKPAGSSGLRTAAWSHLKLAVTCRPAPGSTARRMRLLIAEDEPLTAQRLQRTCREILGGNLRALRVANGVEAASAWLAANPIDVLLLDLNLRGADGMEL